MPGLKKLNRTASALLCLFSGPALLAAEPVAKAATLPAGFLEFLGEWEDANGDWLDPMALEGPDWQSLDDDVEQEDETN